RSASSRPFQFRLPPRLRSLASNLPTIVPSAPGSFGVTSEEPSPGEVPAAPVGLREGAPRQQPLEPKRSHAGNREQPAVACAFELQLRRHCRKSVTRGTPPHATPRRVRDSRRRTRSRSLTRLHKTIPQDDDAGLGVQA